MRKIIHISLIYLACLALAVSCSKNTVPQDVPPVNIKKPIVNSTPRCLDELVAALGYTHGQYTEALMECNILKVQSLDQAIRKIKGQRRVEIVYLNVKCDEIARNLSQFELECKKAILIGGAN